MKEDPVIRIFKQLRRDGLRDDIIIRLLKMGDKAITAYMWAMGREKKKQ